MNDQTIIRVAGLTWELLRKPAIPDSANNVVPSYNSLLRAAKRNHPDNEFLTELPEVEPPANTTELAVLFSQIQRILEAEESDE